MNGKLILKVDDAKSFILLQNVEQGGRISELGFAINAQDVEKFHYSSKFSAPECHWHQSHRFKENVQKRN